MGKSILIVDDAAFMRMMLKDILSRAGYSVVGEASNGVRAVQKYKEVKPDIVTMDITMSEMDGVEALKQIIEFDSDAKVIMCTAVGEQNVVNEAIQSGAKGYVMKPFQADSVLEEIRKVIG